MKLLNQCINKDKTKWLAFGKHDDDDDIVEDVYNELHDDIDENNIDNGDDGKNTFVASRDLLGDGRTSQDSK